MKKLVVLCLLLCLTVLTSLALAQGPLERDSVDNGPVQAFAPSGLDSVALTIKSTWFDLRRYAAFSITAPADCKMRLSAVDGSKTGTVLEPVYGGQWRTLGVSTATPYFNATGCSNGNLQRSKKRQQP